MIPVQECLYDARGLLLVMDLVEKAVGDACSLKKLTYAQS